MRFSSVSGVLRERKKKLSAKHGGRQYFAPSKAISRCALGSPTANKLIYNTLQEIQPEWSG